MAGFIVLDDGRAYAANNQAFRSMVAAIAEALPASPEGIALAKWLLDESGTVQVYMNVDVRRLAPATKEIFLAAIGDAYAVQKRIEPQQPDEYWQSWIGRFSDLVRMIDCVRRGDPPDVFNPHMNGLIPPTGERNGPGW